MKTAYNLPMYI